MTARELCMLDISNKRSNGTTKVKPLPEKEGSFTRYKNEVGYVVFTDQFICKTPGQLTTGYGRESTDHRFQGGNIYRNAASVLTCIENNFSLGSNYTVMGKTRFEKWLWYQAATEASH